MDFETAAKMRSISLGGGEEGLAVSDTEQPNNSLTYLYLYPIYVPGQKRVNWALQPVFPHNTRCLLGGC